MSKFTDSDFRSSSPVFPYKPRQPIDQTIEDALKSSHFLKKPDIIPFPCINFDQPSLENNSGNSSHTDLLAQLEFERSQRKAAESACEKLEEKLLYLQDIEKKYEEYRLKSLKILEFTMEIEKLNTRISILLEENEDLRKRLRNDSDQSSSLSKIKAELDSEEKKNYFLINELKEAKNAYEDLRIVYAKDVASQKERYDHIYEEKMHLEARLRELMTRFERPQRDEDELQEKIRMMKMEYRDKVRKIEDKCRDGGNEELSDRRLKEIEERLSALQGKLAEQSEYNEKALARREFGKEGKGEREMSPYSTWKTLNLGQSPSKRVLNYGSPKNHPNNAYKPERDSYPSSATGGKHSNGSTKRTARSSKSPTRNIPTSPTGRSFSPHRHPLPVKNCQTCIRKHGPDWAIPNQ